MTLQMQKRDGGSDTKGSGALSGGWQEKGVDVCMGHGVSFFDIIAAGPPLSDATHDDGGFENGPWLLTAELWDLMLAG